MYKKVISSLDLLRVRAGDKEFNIMCMCIIIYMHYLYRSFISIDKFLHNIILFHLRSLKVKKHQFSNNFSQFWNFSRLGWDILVKIFGKIDLDDAVKHKFETEDANTTLFKINSGTVEMRDNKLILLAD